MFEQVSRAGVVAATVVMGLLIAGCGDGLPETYPVKGKVVYKGTGQPMQSGTILFQSVENPEIQASGDIEPDGSFELYSSLGKAGTVAGEHQVLIEPPLPEYGETVAVGASYQRFETSGLKQTIKPGENEVLIEVERPKR